VVTFVDGTGGDEDIATTTSPVRRSTMIFGQIAPLYGNGVGDAGSVLESFGFEDLRSQQELVFYNLLNPVAVRTNVLQQASDHLVFTRAVAGFTLDGAAVAQPGAVAADPERVVIAGHSQGAQTLPFVAAADPDLVDGVVSSAGSGGQYHSIAHGPRRLESVGLLTIAPDRLDELNPLLHMVQTVFEAADGSNVPTTQHFINLTGAADTCTTVETGTHFARAQGLASYALAPEISYGDPDLDRIVTTTPVSANSAGATRVQILLPGGHFVYRSNVDRLTSFVQQVHAGTAPVVRPEQFASNTGNCAGQRYDDPPRRFGF
jgi:pimeloyl-ACP methyl ester carboxylesterase